MLTDFLSSDQPSGFLIDATDVDTPERMNFMLDDPICLTQAIMIVAQRDLHHRNIVHVGVADCENAAGRRDRLVRL